MTKDVIVSISGLQIEVLEEEGVESEPIEVVTPAQYFYKNGKHYVLYNEVAEGVPGTTKNKVKIGSGTVEIMKSGVTNSHMIFEKNKKNLTYYDTPYGQIMLAVSTTDLKIEEQEDQIEVKINYELDINHEPLADCQIRMKIESKNTGTFRLS